MSTEGKESVEGAGGIERILFECLEDFSSNLSQSFADGLEGYCHRGPNNTDDTDPNPEMVFSHNNSKSDAHMSHHIMDMVTSIFKNSSILPNLFESFKEQSFKEHTYKEESNEDILKKKSLELASLMDEFKSAGEQVIRRPFGYVIVVNDPPFLLMRKLEIDFNIKKACLGDASYIKVEDPLQL